MAIQLENARLCLDCDTLFDEARCPSCGSESFFPLSRWVRPHVPVIEPAAAPKPATSNVRNASLVIAGSGMAYALWKLFRSPDKKNSDDHNGNSSK
jgi:hypothetical protein